ncbi:hypothetical protein [Phytohabitans rumicis]|uniref:Uncharacterized protein n=1 Tax=Phytohabitans rumicis TaxID=1076125 RepID=A0A6V8LEN3_9ACTN|nr:hypothetical protein [Phytohabitans rumicis]GFJ93271.1 hypothetical protein Prum_069130 [Phytohabitans rumicis]
MSAESGHAGVEPDSIEQTAAALLTRRRRRVRRAFAVVVLAGLGATLAVTAMVQETGRTIGHRPCWPHNRSAGGLAGGRTR